MKTARSTKNPRRRRAATGPVLAPDEARAATEAQQLCRLLEHAARLSRAPGPVRSLAQAG